MIYVSVVLEQNGKKKGMENENPLYVRLIRESCSVTPSPHPETFTDPSTLNTTSKHLSPSGENKSKTNHYFITLVPLCVRG